MATKKTSSTASTSTKKPTSGGTKTTTARSAKPATQDTAAVQGVTLDAAQTEAQPGPPMMTKKELFRQLRAKVPSVKGSDTRMVMEALLDELGAAIVRGESLKLQPLGVVKVQRQKSLPGADMVVMKLRRKKANPEEKDPLAEAAE